MQQSKPSVGKDFVQTSSNIQDPDAAIASIKQAFCWNRFCSDENKNSSRKSAVHDSIVQKLEAENLDLQAELNTLKNIHKSDQKKVVGRTIKTT